MVGALPRRGWGSVAAAGSLVRGLCLAVSVALITGLGVASPARADDPEDTPPADVLVRPDWVSASVQSLSSCLCKEFGLRVG